MNEDLIYFKGPSREKILKNLEKEFKDQFLIFKFKKAIENNLPWLVEECIAEGVDPSLEDQWALYYIDACVISLPGKYEEIRNILFKDNRVKYRGYISYSSLSDKLLGYTF
jgi:hypothetical protein